MERAAAVTVSAGDAGIGLDGKALIVADGKAVAGFCQVIIFVDEADIDVAGTGLAMVAIDTDAFGFGRSE